MKRGSIDISSGRWNWFVGEIISLTDGTVERRTLHFYDPKNPNSNMMVRLDPAAEALNQMTVEELARSFVEARSVEDTEGTTWRVTVGHHRGHIALSVPLDYEETLHPGKLLVFKAGESVRARIFKARPVKIVDFESDLTLGELTNDELLSLIRK